MREIASDEGEEQKTSSGSDVIQEHQAGGLGVHATIFIHCNLQPHQPQLVGSILGISKQASHN